MTRFVRSLMALAACAGGVLLLASCGVEVTAPTSYTAFDSPDGAFQCDCPAGWHVNGRGRQYAGSTFSSGNAEIRMELHPAGSHGAESTSADSPEANQDGAAAAGAETPGAAASGTPLSLADVHEAAKDGFTKYFTDYEEKPAATVKTGLGDACVSEFDYVERITGPVRGYRVTVLLGDNRLQVGCTCPEADWPVLRPAFDHVIASFRPGKAKP